MWPFRQCRCVTTNRPRHQQQQLATTHDTGTLNTCIDWGGTLKQCRAIISPKSLNGRGKDTHCRPDHASEKERYRNSPLSGTAADENKPFLSHAPTEDLRATYEAPKLRRMAKARSARRQDQHAQEYPRCQQTKQTLSSNTRCCHQQSTRRGVKLRRTNLISSSRVVMYSLIILSHPLIACRVATAWPYPGRSTFSNTKKQQNKHKICCFKNINMKNERKNATRQFGGRMREITIRVLPLFGSKTWQSGWGARNRKSETHENPKQSIFPF